MEYTYDLQNYHRPYLSPPSPMSFGMYSLKLKYTAVEYNHQLQEFHSREQRTPVINSKNGMRRFNRDLHSSANLPEPPTFSEPFTDDVAVSPAEGRSVIGSLRLRDYQWEGVRWMLWNWSNKRNSILADEMGLGEMPPPTCLHYFYSASSYSTLSNLP